MGNGFCLGGEQLAIERQKKRFHRRMLLEMDVGETEGREMRIERRKRYIDRAGQFDVTS